MFDGLKEDGRNNGRVIREVPVKVNVSVVKVSACEQVVKLSTQVSRVGARVSDQLLLLILCYLHIQTLS